MTTDRFDIKIPDKPIDEEKIIKLLHRKNTYMEERKRSLGPEYYSARDFWDRLWESEWNALEERLEKNIFETIPTEFPILEIDDELLHLYTFDDFAILHNQGIFRDEKFLIDRKGKWTKNVINDMKTYGYKHKKTIHVSREKYLLMVAMQ